MKKINIDTLHRVPEILDEYGSYVRQIGKTTYCLHTILGYLQVLENEDIIVIITEFKRLPNYFNPLDRLFIKNDLQPIYSIADRRIRFKNNTNRIKFITLDYLIKNHPTDFCNSDSSHDLYLIFDLDNMPAEFYKEELTVLNCHNIDYYKRYLQCQ